MARYFATIIIINYNNPIYSWNKQNHSFAWHYRVFHRDIKSERNNNAAGVIFRLHLFTGLYKMAGRIRDTTMKPFTQLPLPVACLNDLDLSYCNQIGLHVKLFFQIRSRAFFPFIWNRQRSEAMMPILS